MKEKEKKEETVVEGKEEKGKEKKEEIWTVQEVPTQTQPVIVNTKTKEMFTQEIAIAKILNILEELKSFLE